MTKKWLLVLLATAGIGLSGCYNMVKHLEHHVHRAYQQADAFHKELDWYVFDLDEMNPDHWP